MTKALQAALSTVAWACALSAHADCAPIIAAFAKAESTGRSAVYDVASMQAAPKGKPFHVDVSGVGYADVGDHRQKGGGGNAALEGSSLKGREQKGEVRCEPIGESRIAGDAVVGYQIRRMTRALPIRWRPHVDQPLNRYASFSHDGIGSWRRHALGIWQRSGRAGDEIWR